VEVKGRKSGIRLMVTNGYKKRFTSLMRVSNDLNKTMAESYNDDAIRGEA
jgi:hypothetical protein